MSTRILAVIPEAATVEACLDAAAAAALSISNSDVEALHVAVDPSHLISSAEEVDFQILREKCEGTAAERAAAVRQAFDRWLQRGSLPSIAWTQVSAAEADAICKEAKLFDVLVLARPHNSDGVEALHTALYQAGRPFFLAPAKALGESRSLVEKIVIAWNGTPQCRRAIAGAMPWLRAAHANIVLLIAEGEATAPETMGELSGIAYDTVTIARDDERLGDQIISEAKRLGATLLVLGAHRHNMLIEWLAGHTTDQVLAHEELTLFLAH